MIGKIHSFIHFNVCKKYSENKASNQPANWKSLKIFFHKIKMMKSRNIKMWKHHDPKHGKKVGRMDEDVFCYFKLSRVSVRLKDPSLCLLRSVSSPTSRCQISFSQRVTQLKKKKKKINREKTQEKEKEDKDSGFCCSLCHRWPL